MQTYPASQSRSSTKSAVGSQYFPGLQGLQSLTFLFLLALEKEPLGQGVGV